MKRIGNRRAQATVEFALIAPLIFLFLFAIMDMGWMFMKYISVSQAVRESGRSASKGFNLEAIRNRYGFQNGHTFRKGQKNATRYRYDMVDLKLTYGTKVTGETNEVTVTGTVANDFLTPLSGIAHFFGVPSVIPDYYEISATFRLEDDYTAVEQYEPPPPDPNEIPFVLYPEISDPLGFSHELIELVDNEDGTKTITMKITSDGDNGTAALSHVVYGIPMNSEFISGQSISSSEGWSNEFCDPDPTTGLSGLKFDDTALGEDGAIETATVQFVVDELVNNFNIATKAGGGAEIVSYDFGL